MEKSTKVIFSVLISLIVTTTPALQASWIKDGVPVCTDATNQNSPQAVSNGAGGMIVTWADNRGGYEDIFAQQISGKGDLLWTIDGMPICAAVEGQYNPQIAADGAGGAIIAWYDYRNFMSTDIYAQSVDPSGTVRWTTNGVAICTSSGFQYDPQVASDGAGGAIIAWRDTRNGNDDIYAQRVDSSGDVQWITDIPVCTAVGEQSSAQIISDGSGGAIVVWRDYRYGNYDIYAQRVDHSGDLVWTLDGVAVCTDPYIQNYIAIAPDGYHGVIATWADLRTGTFDILAQRIDASGTARWTANGAGVSIWSLSQCIPSIVYDEAGAVIIVWEDNRNGPSDVYAQRVDSTGTGSWAIGGVPICEAAYEQSYPKVVSDGSGGAVVAWYDDRGDSYDVYAQRFDSSGEIFWDGDGVPVCTFSETQIDLMAVSNGEGGAVVAWKDYRSGGNSDIYAQEIDCDGLVGFLPPEICSVADVPDDEGGWVRLTIDRASYDHEDWAECPTAIYNIWQLVDYPPPYDGHPCDYSSLEPGEILRSGEFPPGSWELLGSFAACQKEQYEFRAGTLADSTESGIPYSVYAVSAHTVNPLIWCISEPDSGYSVDNLPPCVPSMLASEEVNDPDGLEISWQPNTENDLCCYRVYRGTSGYFVPGPENLVGSPGAPLFIDYEWTEGSGYYYKISSVDRHGNESGFALLTPDDITHVEVPALSYLEQNYPNPFNPQTTIRFGLKADGFVSLRIYDAAGRIVRVLVEEERAARHYEEAWDGCDGSGSPVASGVYFYRLIAGDFRGSRKMVLLR